MATLSDATARHSRLVDELNRLTETIDTSEKNKRATNDLIKTVRNLEEDIGYEERRIEDSNTSAMTFDREFIERKEQMPDPFKPDKMKVLQNFTFFFFFVSYLIFVLALTLTLEQKLITLGMGAGVGFVIIMLLYVYA